MKEQQFVHGQKLVYTTYNLSVFDRWTEEGCVCLNSKCSYCNCSYPDIEDLSNSTSVSVGGQRRQSTDKAGRAFKIAKQTFISIAVRRRRKCEITYDTQGAPIECSGHGSCDAGKCSCAGGWAGPMCNNSCTDCNGHGSCSPADGRCKCSPGWAGMHCTVQPNIFGFYPPYAPPMALVDIQVTGTGFGSTDSTPEVRIGNTFCRESVWQSPSRIVCKLSPGVGEGQVVSTFASGLSDSSDIADSKATSAFGLFFSYSAPVITDLKPLNGPTTGGYVVTITGRNFGNHWNDRMAYDGRVRFNMSLCSPQQWQSDSSLRCAVPAGKGRNVPVLIEIPAGKPRDKCTGEFLGNTTTFLSTREERCGSCEGCRSFDYDPPVIIELRAGSNRKPETYLFRGGELMTVIGTNFGYDCKTQFSCDNDAKVAVGPGMLNFDDEHQSARDNKLTCVFGCFCALSLVPQIRTTA